MFAQLYRCSKCGETWKTETIEIIDTERDDVEWVLICQICGSTIWEEIIGPNGKPVFHVLTEEEMEIEMSSPNDFIE